MSSNNQSRFFHHFMPKTMQCIVFPPTVSSSLLPSSPASPPSSTMNEHILNLTASLSKHCPLPESTTSKPAEIRHPTRNQENLDEAPGKRMDNNNSRDSTQPVTSVSPDPGNCNDDEMERSGIDISGEKVLEKVDVNYNKVKGRDSSVGDDHAVKEVEDDVTNESCKSSVSSSSDNDHYDEDQMADVDVDDTASSDDGDGIGAELRRSPQCIENSGSRLASVNSTKKSAALAFGIDRILSFSCSDDEKDQTRPLSPAVDSSTSASPTLVVSNLSSKSENFGEPLKVSKGDYSSKNLHHPPIISKLKLFAASNSEQKRSTTLPYFHHSYGPYHHHHSHHINSIITSASSAASIHNHNSPHHSLSHCAECLFLRRYCGGGNGNGGSSSGLSNRARANIPSSSSAASANNVATNNMQFSSSMATPCGPTSALSASFTWMANPSIYDSSSIIPPVPGYNSHVPLQPSFGISASGFSTLASIQQCNSGGSSGRRKRSWSRAVFSNLQRKGLEKRFQLQKYITKPDRRQLAATLGLTDAQVKVWFQNRRMKWRHSKEGKVSSGTGDNGNAATITPTSSSSPPVTSTTPSKGDGATKDKKT